MDIFTHAVLPLAALAFLRRPLAERLAIGLGAAMPDMDVFFSWATRLCDDPCFAFTHRGLSHTVWGAPLLGALGLAIVTMPWWSRRWPRMAAFQLGPMTLLAALVGGLSHVALDALTITGTPALWPLTLQRFTLNIYFFSLLYTAPLALWVVWRLFRGTLQERHLKLAALGLVAMLVAGGALRVATMPQGLGADAVVQPSPLDGEWLVAKPGAAPGSWEVATTSVWRASLHTTHAGNATAASADAVARAQALGAWKGWAWTNEAPLVNATAIEDGWRLEFRDAFALHRNATGWNIGGFARERPLVIEVARGEARVVERAPFFGAG
ncbi:MAG TPA: metal-dependent hydrolase [Candidatus Thermoplasmatota archaeon]|nr:metal-dependent hydrolase [Candidatus Thermoplasmatota archaeon]